MQKRKSLTLFVVLMFIVMVAGMLGSTVVLRTAHIGYASSMELDGMYAFTDKFTRDASAFAGRGWNDDLFSSIVMNVGDNNFWIDGVEYESEPAEMIRGELYLPAVKIAEALNYSVVLDEATEEIVINYDDQRTTRISRAQRTGKRDLEQALNFDIVEQNGRITITNNFQTKQLILRSRELNLRNTHGASDLITDNRGFYVLEYKTERQARQALKNLQASANTKYVEPNTIIGIPTPVELEDGIESGKIIAQNTNGESSPFSNRWGSLRINADLMKDYLADAGKTVDHVVVAVVDSGVNHLHPYLASRVDAYRGWDYVGRRQIPANLTAMSNHGTHVAGTIVDCTPSNVRIMPVRVLGNNGSGNSVNLMLGMRFAAEQGARLMNLSLGGPFNPAINETVRYCTALGSLCITSAGNDHGADVLGSSPAGAALAVTVSATGNTGITPSNSDPYTSDFLARYSNIGSGIDVAAPGSNIMSASWSSSGTFNYDYKNGTSMAAPHVSAAAAMLALEYPSYTPQQLKEEIMATTVDLGAPGWDPYFGAGIVDLRMFFINRKGAAHVNATSVSFSSISLTEASPTAAALSPVTSVEVSHKKTAAALRSKYVSLAVNTVPSNATNKALTVTTSNANVANHVGANYGGVLAIEDVGTADIVAAMGTGMGVCPVVVKPNETFTEELWVDFAAPNFAGGDGTRGNPYQIATAEQLAKIAYDAAVYAFSGTEVFYELINDIDLAGKEWYPIAPTRFYTDTASPQMQRWNEGLWDGNFDGNYNTIWNMKISQIVRDSAYVVSGRALFANCGDVSIKNLALENASSTNAFLVCDTSDGGAGVTISNCYASGASASGLVYDAQNSYIENCYVKTSGAVSTGYTGYGMGYAGFVGAVSGSTVINNCYSYGDLAPLETFEYVVGFALFVSGANARVINCFTATSLSNYFSSLFVSGFTYTKVAAIIDKCYYTQSTLRGRLSDDTPALTDLTPESTISLRTQDFYDDLSNWNSNFPWDFKNTWAIDPTGVINDGYPYLRGFARGGEQILPREQTPDVSINFVTEQLTGLTVGDRYVINSGVPFVAEETTLAISPSWLGTVIQIVKVGDKTTTSDSPAKRLSVPVRRLAPSVGKNDCRNLHNDDGMITGVSTAVEYRPSMSSTWTDCDGTVIAGLVPGVYEVRFRATENAFVSEISSVTINAAPIQEEMPSAVIDYFNEKLTNLIEGATYRFNSQSVTMTATTYDIPSEWFGREVSIVHVGIGITRADSEAQIVLIPARPSAPTIGATDCTTLSNDDGTITGVSVAMEYRQNTASTWTDCADATVSGLVNGYYYVRVKATSASFAGNHAAVVVGSYAALPREATPNLEVDFWADSLGRLVNGARYCINYGEPFTAIGSRCAISSLWFGTTIQIVRIGDGGSTSDSIVQLLDIPARPAAPIVGKTDCSKPDAYDGTITGLSSAMEYMNADSGRWGVAPNGVLIGRVPGVYHVRYRATSSSFSGEIATVIIYESSAISQLTPNATIDYADEKITGLVQGATYKFNDTVVKLEGTTYDIDASWFGEIISITRISGDAVGFDSIPQELKIIGKQNISATVEVVGNNKITGLTAAMEYRKEGSADWISCGGEELSGLAPGVYEFRVGATDTSFASTSFRITIDEVVSGKSNAGMIVLIALICVAAAGVPVGIIYITRFKRKKVGQSDNVY